MKMNKRFLSILFSLALVLGMSRTAYADDTKVGSATYTIADGVLTVGSGSFTKEQWRTIFLTTSSNGTPTGAKEIAKNITKVVFEQGAATSGTAGMFYGWTALQEADLSKLNTSGATDLWSMFSGCTKLVTVDLSSIDNNNVIYYENMFLNCTSLKTILVGQNWTTPSTKSERNVSMFGGCYALVGGNGTTYSYTYNNGNSTGYRKEKQYAIIDGAEGKAGLLTGPFQAHTHNFSYTANEAVITATCNSTTGICDLTDKKVTLTLKAPAINQYGMGQNEKATLDGTNAFNAATGKAISEANIEYYKGETKLDTAPKDAGNYTAKLTVENHTATVSYTIQKGNNINAVGKPQVVSKTENSITLKATTGYEYKCGDGAWQTSSEFTGLTAGTSYTFYQRIAETANLNPSAASAGTEVSTNPHIHVHDFEYSLSEDGKTITAKCKKTDPGHTGADSITLTLNTPMLLVVPETRDVGSTSMSIISPNYAATLTGLQDFKALTGLNIQIKYYKVDGETNTAIDNYPHEAGTYLAEITVGEQNACVTYTISKIDLTADKFTYTAPENLIYNGEAKTATVTSKKEGIGEVTVEYWNAKGEKLDGVPVNAETYTVKISVTESTRYNKVEHLTSDDWTFTVTKASATVTTAPTAKTLTANGQAQALVTAGSASGGVMQYSLDNTNWSAEIPTAVNVGTYTVYYKVIGDANHNDTEAQSVSVEIKSKPSPAPTPEPEPEPEPEQKSIIIGTESSADAASISDYLEGKTEEQLQSVTELKAENISSLTDLSGIEKLKNLETLNIKNAENLTDISAVKELENLKTIDVSGCTALGNANLSGMKNLTEVSANGCESLSKLDVKGCDNLKKVDISGCKSLENADLSSLQNLAEVSAKGCESLSELDISNCESLTSLDCSESGIDTLKTDGCVKLANLDCHENSLTQLDADKNSLPNLNSLICYGQMRFNIELDASSAGYALDLQQYVSEKSLSASKIFSAVKTSSLSKVLSVKAYDANGKELAASFDEITGVITFDSRPHLITYDYNTGFISSESADVLMDVSLYMTDEQEDTPVTNATSSHGSSSGCNVNNFGLLALALALARRCRRK